MNHTEETFCFNYSEKNIQDFVAQLNLDGLTDKEKALKIYKAVRDGWKYNPYKIRLQKEAWKASEIIERKEGHCLDKAVILITCLRAVGIPTKIHLVKVRNHIGVERIIEKLGTDELTPHAYAEVFLNNKWIGATPAFNIELCHFLNVEPLEFDGENDSLFQEFDKTGGKFMEYLEDYGSFSEMPLDFIFQNMKDNYPQISKGIKNDVFLVE